MINIKNLSFSYDNKSPELLKDINLSIDKGIYLSIVGENGSCKTTLIKLILGILKPNKGSIEINSELIGYVPQRLDSFNSQFPITVKEVLNCHKKTLKDKNIDIDSILKQVNMEDFKDRLLGMLSGGQQQRILISRALMGNPDIIILDDDNMSENNYEEVLNHLQLILYNKKFRKHLDDVKNNWINIPSEKVIDNVINFFENLIKIKI